MELRSLGLSRKLATMTRKFNPENYMFLTCRGTETQRFISNAENSERTETFVYYFPVVSGSSTNLCEFRVQKNINVRINVLICVLINVSP